MLDESLHNVMIFCPFAGENLLKFGKWMLQLSIFCNIVMIILLLEINIEVNVDSMVV